MIHIYFDGGANPNPGKAYGSFEIERNGVRLARVERMEHGDGLGNNQAEYLTLLAALDRLREVEPDYVGPLEIWTDSRLIERQLTRHWKVEHPKIKPLVKRVFEFFTMPCGSWSVRWHGRANNVERFGH
jgi:ribonuclease HI